jgi:hypothetical protein
MGDAGEGLVDAEARIQERFEALQQAQAERRVIEVRDLEARRALESLRLARAELAGQLKGTAHERRRTLIVQAMAELDRRMADLRPAEGAEVVT